MLQWHTLTREEKLSLIAKLSLTRPTAEKWWLKKRASAGPKPKKHRAGSRKSKQIKFSNPQAQALFDKLPPEMRSWLKAK
jgi:hypothetical protein